MNKDDLEKAEKEYLKTMGHEPEIEPKSKNDELKEYEERYLERLSEPKKEEILEILSSVVNHKDHKKNGDEKIILKELQDEFGMILKLHTLAKNSVYKRYKQWQNDYVRKYKQDKKIADFISAILKDYAIYYPDILDHDSPLDAIEWIGRNGISDDIIKIIKELKEKIDKLIQGKDLDEIFRDNESHKKKIQKSKERREYEHPS